MTAEGGPIVLKILHTADWHLGRSFPQFEGGPPHVSEGAARKLERARLEVVDAILGQARQNDVDAVLVAGDIFDAPHPPEDSWSGLARKLAALRGWTRPIVLLPGNHDPLTPTSVFAPQHPFRRALPPFVHVVDQDDFALPLAEGAAVVHAIPCRSQAGQNDLALALPARALGDERIRIGLVHGSTFDVAGFQTHFPIARDAAERRGFDYLAIGDTHSFRDVTPQARAPVVYPGAPEPTDFREDGGSVAVVLFPRGRASRPRVERREVGRYRWRDETCPSLAALRALRAEDPAVLDRTVLRLELPFAVGLAEVDEVRALLDELRGTNAVAGAAAVFLTAKGELCGLEVEPGEAALPDDAPEVLRVAWRRLLERAEAPPAGAVASAGPDERALARRALEHLYRAVRAHPRTRSGA